MPQSPGTPLQIRSRKKTVVIDDPAVPSSALQALLLCFPVYASTSRTGNNFCIDGVVRSLSGTTRRVMVHTFFHRLPLPDLSVYLDGRVLLQHKSCADCTFPHSHIYDGVRDGTGDSFFGVARELVASFTYASALRHSACNHRIDRRSANLNGLKSHV